MVFWVLAAMAAGSVAATLWIPRDAIDHEIARGMDPGYEQHLQPVTVLLRNRRLMTFAVAVVAFHFANAAMLPLVGQLLALHNKDAGTALMAVCIVAAQLVMVPVAYWPELTPTPGDASRSSCSDSPCSPRAGFSTRCRTTRTGWWACSCWTASEPGSSERCFPSSSRT